MAEPRHRPPGDDRFLVSLGRHVAGAAALVTVMAGVFWGIGSIAGDDGELVVADSPPAGTPTEDTGTGTTTPDDGAEGATPSPTRTDEGAPSPTGTGSPSPAGTAPTEAGSIPPSEISIQVLDAVRLEGNTATRDLADEIEADGYRVVVVHEASKVYDVTTVFWTPGYEDSARQLAAAYGIGRVEEKPSNLSDTVRVHLVVGRDRA